MVKKFDMERNSHDCTPMSISVKISLGFTSMCVNSTLYRSMIESLLYITASKADNAFNVGIYAKFQSNPKESYLAVIKKNLKIPWCYNKIWCMLFKRFKLESSWLFRC